MRRKPGTSSYTPTYQDSPNTQPNISTSPAALQMKSRLLPALKRLIHGRNRIRELVRQRPRLERIQRLLQLQHRADPKHHGVPVPAVQLRVEPRPAQRRRVPAHPVLLGGPPHRGYRVVGRGARVELEGAFSDGVLRGGLLETQWNGCWGRCCLRRCSSASRWSSFRRCPRKDLLHRD